MLEVQEEVQVQLKRDRPWKVYWRGKKYPVASLLEYGVIHAGELLNAERRAYFRLRTACGIMDLYKVRANKAPRWILASVETV